VSAEPVVVCPLEFERRALLGAGLGTRCRVECCGPGAAAVGAWAEGATPAAPVILCGLAGSARDPYRERAAFAARAVVLEDGRLLDPPLGAGPGPAPLIGSADRTLATLAEKAEWARRTGADLVDLESATFARIADERGWRWTVVRGVSDGPRTALPPGLDDWVDDRGRTRLGAVCGAILRRRARIRQLIRLRAAGRAAMRAAAGVIGPMLGDPDGPSP
jgi:hypothetical protein